MKTIYLAGNVFEYETNEELIKEALKYKIKIGAGCKIESGCKIGAGCVIEVGCTIKESLLIKNNPRRYGYVSSSFNNQKNHELNIQLGCHTRTLEEWERNFYNNDKEFPKGDPQTKFRVQIYLMHLHYWKPEYKSFLE